MSRELNIRQTMRRKRDRVEALKAEMAGYYSRIPSFPRPMWVISLIHGDAQDDLPERMN
jgi:hypothetical protein